MSRAMDETKKPSQVQALEALRQIQELAARHQVKFGVAAMSLHGITWSVHDVMNAIEKAKVCSPAAKGTAFVVNGPDIDDLPLRVVLHFNDDGVHVLDVMRDGSGDGGERKHE